MDKIMNAIEPIGIGLLAVMNPDDGHGITESIIAIIIVVGVFSLLFFKIEVPTWLVGTFTFIGGAWLGGQAQINVNTTNNKQRKK